MDLPTQNPVFLIETDKIKPNPQQPRKDFDEEGLRELAGSIREFGLLQPIIVSKIEQETETGTQVEYQLIAGERRWRACQLLGLERLPAIVKNVSLDRERLEMAIVENIQRADLNAIESARAFARLQDEFGLTQREIATRIGKSRETVANTIRLLNLPTQIQEAISQSLISESQARLLLAISDLSQQQSLFNDILHNSLSVRELKSRIQKIKSVQVPPVPAEAKEENPAAPAVDPELLALQKELETALGAQVKLESLGSKGKITIAFYSSEELRGIVDKLRQPKSNQNENENGDGTNQEFTL